MLPVLAKAVRDVELAVQRSRVRPSTRSTFQAVALLVREERTRVQTAELGESARAEQLKRIDGIATILARTAARDGSLLALLTEDAELVQGTRALLSEMRAAAGMEDPEPQPALEPVSSGASPRPERQVVPRSVISRQLANPFLEPDFSAPPPAPRPRLLANWELLNPLLRAFENASGGAPVVHAAARAGHAADPGRARAHAAPGAGRAGRGATGTGRSCSPTSRAWARPRRRCWPPRSPARTRCSSSSPTSSRPTGRARSASGRRAAPPPWCTATATPSTASPTS